MEMYAVLGEKLGHTLSPQIHSHIFKALGIDGNYGVIEAKREDIHKVADAFKTLNYRGVNVTIPYKEMIMPYLDEISPEAQSIGAINTIDFKSGNTIGYNTDYYGFGMMLEHAAVSLEDKEVVLFGAGGAAKALIAYMHDAKAKSILVVSSVPEELVTMKERFAYIDTASIEEIDRFKGDVAVNATPVGMYPSMMDQSIIAEEIIRRFSVAVDIVYNPLETKFLKLARENGLTVVTGLYMLIFQAIKAEEIFQGTAIDITIADEIYNDLSKLFM